MGLESGITVYQAIGALRVCEHDLLRQLDRREDAEPGEQLPDISDGDPNDLAG